jgi:hypothetical protein
MSARLRNLSRHLSSTNDVDVLVPPERPLRDLSPDEMECFVRDRVIHVSGVLDPAWLQRIEDAVDSQTPKTDAGLQSMNVNTWHVDDSMHRIIMNCPLAHLAQQALSCLSPSSGQEPTLKPIRFFYDQMFVKHPREAAANELQRTDAQGPLGNTPWHHDITFWPVSGEQIVSVWIALDDTNLGNGGLEFVPGSSGFGERYQAIGVGGAADRMPFSSDTLRPLPKIKSATSGETEGGLSAISFEMQAGDVLIFDTKILHGAPPNLSPRPRRGLALRYLGSDVKFDENKHGELTSMAPFNCYDESLANGDKVSGYAYPQILPHKIPAEVNRRLEGEILPSKVLMKKWLRRMQAASEAAAVPAAATGGSGAIAGE